MAGPGQEREADELPLGSEAFGRRETAGSTLAPLGGETFLGGSMSIRSRLVPLLALCFAGCYHASVETGRAPGTQHIEKGWASSFFGGAIPPSTVDAKAACPNGVSKVETQHSALNQMVGILTLAIYTPISIDVTCAAAPLAQAPQHPVNSAANVALKKTSATR